MAAITFMEIVIDNTTRIVVLIMTPRVKAGNVLKKLFIFVFVYKYSLAVSFIYKC